MMSRNIVRKAKICWWKFSISPEHEKKIVARLPLLRRAIFNIIKIMQSGDGEKGRLSLVVDIPSGPVSPQHSSAGTQRPSIPTFFCLFSSNAQTDKCRSLILHPLISPDLPLQLPCPPSYFQHALAHLLLMHIHSAYICFGNPW